MRLWLKLSTLLLASAGLAVVAIKLRIRFLEKRFAKKHAQLIPSMHFIAGSHLSHSAVVEQEELLKTDQTNMRARSLLLGYYGRSDNGVFDREKYCEHALWVIQNQPGHALAKECEFYDPDLPEGAYEQGKQLWLQHRSQFFRNHCV